MMNFNADMPSAPAQNPPVVAQASAPPLAAAAVAVSLATGGQAPDASSAVAAPQELLLISGQIWGADKAELTPLKASWGQARAPEAGPYLLRIVTARGLLDYRFAPRQIDHLPAEQHFGFTIPHPGPIFSLSILNGDRVLMRTEAHAMAASVLPKSPVQVKEKKGVLQLSWNHNAYRYLTVTHVGESRSVLGVDLEGGSAKLPTASLPAGGRFEFSLSDGLNAVRVAQRRR